MNILTNAEIARKYGISRPTVTRWIDFALSGKNNLQLHLSNNKYQILDNPHNQSEVNRLLVEGKKYKRNIPLKKASPSSEFYDIFTIEEIIEIITNLEFHKNLNLKFSYKNGGAEIWNDRYNTGISPIKKATIELTTNIIDDFKYFLGDFSKINLIDIGPGNSHPVKHLVSKLSKANLLNSYIPIDISNEILEISKKNIQSWFPAIKTISYQKDIEIDNFAKIFLENKSFSKNLPNVILFIGNTISNYSDRVRILKNLSSSLTKNDLLVITFSLDSESNKSLVNYAKSSQADIHHSWVLKLLGIDTRECETIIEYNQVQNGKIKKLKLEKDYLLSFKLFEEEKELPLFSNDNIKIWEHYLISHNKFLDELEEANLELLVSKKDVELNNSLVICRAIY